MKRDRSGDHRLRVVVALAAVCVVVLGVACFPAGLALAGALGALVGAGAALAASWCLVPSHIRPFVGAAVKGRLGELRAALARAIGGDELDNAGG